MCVYIVRFSVFIHFYLYCFIVFYLIYYHLHSYILKIRYIYIYINIFDIYSNIIIWGHSTRPSQEMSHKAPSREPTWPLNPDLSPSQLLPPAAAAAAAAAAAVPSAGWPGSVSRHDDEQLHGRPGAGRRARGRADGSHAGPDDHELHGDGPHAHGSRPGTPGTVLDRMALGRMSPIVRGFDLLFNIGSGLEPQCLQLKK